MTTGYPYTVIGNRNGWLLRLVIGRSVPDGFAVIDVCNDANGHSLPRFWSLPRYPNDVKGLRRGHGLVDVSKPSCMPREDKHLRQAIHRCFGSCLAKEETL